MRTTTISGREANLLLFALDAYLGVDGNGKLRSTEDHFSIEQAQALRDRLFSIHEHDPKDRLED